MPGAAGAAAASMPQQSLAHAVVPQCAQLAHEHLVLTAARRGCRLKLDGPYDSKVLPVVLAVTLVTSLLVVFTGAVSRLHSDA